MLINPKYYLYWDACIFLAHLNHEPGRFEVIEELWDEIEKKEGQIITSAISIIEVAKTQQEKDNQLLDSTIENKLDAMWHDPFIRTVEISPNLLFEARKLMRDDLKRGGILKPLDAIHLATANWINRYSPTRIDEFQTYDPGLKRFALDIGMSIVEPTIKQPKLL
jgi:predicted nucleic acid-binding protein